MQVMQWTNDSISSNNLTSFSRLYRSQALLTICQVLSHMFMDQRSEPKEKEAGLSLNIDDMTPKIQVQVANHTSDVTEAEIQKRALH